ncbi:anti-sigma factor domain-containing protein [Rhizobium rhizogenes]|uniref:anti-sigma factor n=1 Tax=Rhizobium rhizogenes TaxID=359 RepID=UPI001572BF0E|nr:anti-sigma factor [Rhizobium rhizogenes]NTF44116.1 anti-sigma factor [Rhizobium rhizogenes]
MSDEDRSRDEILAGEYVIGVLSVAGRQDVERRIVSDRGFARLVERWQQDLAAFNDDYQEATPSAAVFGKIEQRLFGAPTQNRVGLLDTVKFWRWVSIGMSLVALVAVIYGSGVLQPGRRSVAFVAELSAPKSAVNLLASFDASTGRVRLVPIATGQPQEKSMQLWLVPGSGNPQSLGVFQPDGKGELLIPADMRGTVSDGATLAVSLEPFGGSTTGLPTGPVIASGIAHRL